MYSILIILSKNQWFVSMDFYLRKYAPEIQVMLKLIQKPLRYKDGNL